MIWINRKLVVIGLDKIMVPGCEPPTSATSLTLSRTLPCRGNPLVDLDAALAAIPGSYVQYGPNSGHGIRQKWFVMPPVIQGCPCPEEPDWYSVLRDLITEDETVVEDWSGCHAIDPGFCPPSDYETAPAPATSPYVPEGTTPNGVGLLLPGKRYWGEEL